MDRISEFIDYLQVRNEFGQTIYGHLAQIIAKLLDDHPEDAAAAIASISREIKASVGCYDDEKAGKTYEPVLSDDDFARLEEVLKTSLSSDHATSVLKPCKTIVPNILRLNEQLKLVGHGFDDVTASILQKRISQFEVERRGYFSVISFFGRFTTTSGYYYVIECLPFKPRKKMFRFQGPGPASVNSDILDLSTEQNATATEVIAPPPSALSKNGKPANYTYLTDRKLKKLSDEERLYLDPDDLEFDLRTIAPRPKRLYPHVEPAGDGVHPEGINRFVYFATADLLVSDVNQVVKWVRLPDLEARQLKLSRFINVRLSGNLSRRIYDRLPPFPGCEAHYLRCIITRIKHGAELAPAACLVPGPEPEEADEDLTEEEQARQKALMFADPAAVADFSKDLCEPDEPVDPKMIGKSVLPWPERNREIASVEFVELLELANWVHSCPVLSHRGKVLPWTYPEEEEEPEEEAEEEEPEEEEKEEPEEEAPVEEEKVEDEEDANEEEKGEDGEEKGEGEGEEEPEEEEPEEPLPPPKKPVQERLDAAYAESDQLRILNEATDTYKQIARQKCCFTVPRAFWEATRDPWDPVIKENRSVYQSSRYFGLEIAPVDINCKEQELDDKEREYWDKEQEIEDTLKEQDEQLLEGDQYDEEKEVIQKDRPEMLSTADADAPLVLYAGPMGSVDVNAEEVDGQKVVPAYTVIFNKTLNRHSPVVVRSNRWPGMLNVCFNHSNGDPLVYTSIYIGNGRQTESINALDKYRAVLPAPMQLPPADILEEDDPVLEIETECRERVEDIERRDKDELDRLIRERLERKEARLAEKRARAEERARELAAQEEQEEAEEEDES